MYCDVGPVEHREQGYGSVFSTDEAEYGLPQATPYFHPFRSYILYHVARAFKQRTSSTQYLLFREGFHQVAARNIESLDYWTSSPACANRFEDWNRVAELAICCEPTAYQTVFNEERFSILEAYDSLRQRRRDFQRILSAFLAETPLDKIHNAREELCCDAEVIDDNKLLHVLLRLMSSHERQKVRDHIGAALLFLSMAEMIRREAETAISEYLAEEDGMGFGEWMAGARKSIFGAERFLDSAPETRRNFLTSMGLDFGVKVRCYVEGETELGALEAAVGSGYGIQFVNLRGAFAEGRGKGLSFVDSLRNDFKSKIFSVIALDGDHEDNIRLIRKAAGDGVFLGRFFIAEPDFEFENFVLDELIDAAMALINQEYD